MIEPDLEERYEIERAEAVANHDRTGDHKWMEVTVHNAPQRQFLCCYCKAEKFEPWGASR